MNKRIAIVSGGSGGLGKEYANLLNAEYPQCDEYWLLGRRQDKLDAACAEIPKANGIRIDLTCKEDMAKFNALLVSQKPDICLLINNAGCGYLGAFDQSKPEEQERTVQLDVAAFTMLTHACLPYMSQGAQIICISSIAGFVPNINMAVYSASKSYVLAFCRALREELKPRGINVLAVCPGPMETEFLSIGRIKGNSKTFDTLPYCDAKKVAANSIAASKRGHAVYTPKLFYKFYRVLAHILPKCLLMKLAKT